MHSCVCGVRVMCVSSVYLKNIPLSQKKRAVTIAPLFVWCAVPCVVVIRNTLYHDTVPRTIVLPGKTAFQGNPSVGKDSCRHTLYHDLLSGQPQSGKVFTVIRHIFRHPAPDGSIYLPTDSSPHDDAIHHPKRLEASSHLMHHQLSPPWTNKTKQRRRRNLNFLLSKLAVLLRATDPRCAVDTCEMHISNLVHRD